MVAAKFDCTGQRFGLLTVLGKAERSIPRCGSTSTPWRLQCDCGVIVELFRSDFARTSYPRKSCGCLSKNRKACPLSKRKPRDLTGQVFGELTVLETIPGTHDPDGRRIRVTYRCRCSCGAIVIKNDHCFAELRKRKRGSWINCGGKHHLLGAWYPPMPIPMPPIVGYLIEKYTHLAEMEDFLKINQEVQDWRRERLERACWIVTYRRRQGESIGDEHEANYVKKSLRYAREALKAIEWRNYNRPCENLRGDCMAQDPGTADGTKRTVSEVLICAPPARPAKKLTYGRR